MLLERSKWDVWNYLSFRTCGNQVVVSAIQAIVFLHDSVPRKNHQNDEISYELS